MWRTHGSDPGPHKLGPDSSRRRGLDSGDDLQIRPVVDDVERWIRRTLKVEVEEINPHSVIETKGPRQRDSTMGPRLRPFRTFRTNKILTHPSHQVLFGPAGPKNPKKLPI
eukprot:4668590-Pyramimonas_sp.AAC.1